jgi:hypothetical protein
VNEIIVPCRSKALTLISNTRGTRPRMSGMLRQPSQSSSVSLPMGAISGLIIATGDIPTSSSSTPATNSRTLSCT